ncbi:MAG: radical SAM protein [Desulfovibrionaceae bacterium]|nr:radical SAM protein [Desulfovibrionaceae bacterium]
MHYEGNVIRPPSEADSILLQVTVGCSHNACAFCGAYLGERFRLKELDVVFADIEFAARTMTRARRLFLLSGDALAAPQSYLLTVLARIRERLPRVARTAAYASAKSLGGKSGAELAQLKSLGLATVYMGLESGDDALLAAMGKQADLAAMLKQAAKVMGAGLKLSVTVINGLAGVAGSTAHALATGRALSLMQPDQAAFLSLIPVPGTPLWEELRAGRFELPDARGMLGELRLMLERTDVSRGLFLANHASNYLPLPLRLPRDKQAGLDQRASALAGERALTPEGRRRL